MMKYEQRSEQIAGIYCFNDCLELVENFTEGTLKQDKLSIAAQLTMACLLSEIVDQLAVLNKRLENSSL